MYERFKDVEYIKIINNTTEEEIVTIDFLDEYNPFKQKEGYSIHIKHKKF